VTNSADAAQIANNRTNASRAALTTGSWVSLRQLCHELRNAYRQSSLCRNNSCGRAEYVDIHQCRRNVTWFCPSAVQEVTLRQLHARTGLAHFLVTILVVLATFAPELWGATFLQSVSNQTEFAPSDSDPGETSTSLGSALGIAAEDFEEDEEEDNPALASAATDCECLVAESRTASAPTMGTGKRQDSVHFPTGPPIS